MNFTISNLRLSHLILQLKYLSAVLKDRGIRYALAKFSKRLYHKLKDSQTTGETQWRTGIDNIKNENQELNENIVLNIENTWSNDYGIGIKGWIFNTNRPINKVEICVDGVSAPITAWHARPDVAAANPQYKFTDNCGFSVHIPRLAEHRVTLKAESQGKTWTRTETLTGSKPQHSTDFPEGGSLFADFIKLVNDNQLKVLEIGSRVVSPGSSTKRCLFPGASSYTGFDYYPDSNTDVVGDAHRLSQYFGNQRFDAIFSLSVFEHLAMPWVVAMEINKLLELGGITFHATHFAWPVHERPWDFWRFTDEGLKVLFSPALGFETIKAGLFAPLRMHLDNVEGQEALAMQPGFGGVAILAKKVASVDLEKIKWDVTPEGILGSSSHYPLP
jgi:hypothetical protein